MKTLTQFMAEATIITHIGKDNKLGGMGGQKAVHHGETGYGKDNTTFEKYLNFDGGRMLHTTKLGKLKGMDVLHFHKNPTKSRWGDDNPAEDHYVLHDPKTKMVHLHVNGKKEHGVMKISVLSGSGESPVKAHDFYHHLLKHHVKALVGTSHSEGGQKVWNKLANKRSVSVHGWDHEKNKPVNIDGRDPLQTHDTPGERNAHYKDHSDAVSAAVPEPTSSSRRALDKYFADRGAAHKKIPRETEPDDRANMHLVASYHPMKKLKAKQAAYNKETAKG